MSEIQRICSQCGKSGPLEARYCPHCGYDTEASGLPAPRNLLPANLTKAALPILAGVASLALRAGWKLLQDHLAESAAASHAVTKPQNSKITPRRESPAPRQPRRVVRIRSSWAMGDANGIWQQGNSEHTIEFDE